MSGHVVIFKEGEEVLHVELLDEDFAFISRAVQLVSSAYATE